MPENRYIKVEGHRPRLFEFSIVLIVIALLIYMGVDYYKRPAADSVVNVAVLNSQVFSRMISNVNAIGRTSSSGFVQVDDVYFYLNENGWPANTDGQVSPSLKNQTAEECQQIWNAVFSSAPPSAIEGDGYTKKIDYKISLNKNVICRYELIGKQEASYFLDYDVSNGTVAAVRP